MEVSNTSNLHGRHRICLNRLCPTLIYLSGILVFHFDESIRDEESEILESTKGKKIGVK